MLRGSHSQSLSSHFEAIQYVPEAAYPKFVVSHGSYFASTEGRAHLILTLTLKLFHIFRGSRTLSLYPRTRAISHALMVVIPRNASSMRRILACSDGRLTSKPSLSVELARKLRGWRTLNLYSCFEAIPRALRVAFPQFAPPRWSYSAGSEGRIPPVCTLTLKLF